MIDHHNVTYTSVLVLMSEIMRVWEMGGGRGGGSRGTGTRMGRQITVTADTVEHQDTESAVQLCGVAYLVI